ncbi:hypothetical protein B0H16DRAFT_1763492 [Mycena metata]|uniref:Uncharacterized protein n=1 Tax=Mycena metata TaxID=1033252 RepID=A0AAD7JXT0_9AGAR|nr:hypothetical protein B0H16DRAFT_1763492 [Mycena metata]
MSEFSSCRGCSNVTLHFASQRGQLDIVQFLVLQNANGDDSDLGEFERAKELEVLAVLEKQKRTKVEHGHSTNAQATIPSCSYSTTAPPSMRRVDPLLLLHNLNNHCNGILHLLRAHGANLNAVYARTPAVDVTVQSQAGVHGPLGNRACAYGY